jgi:hypothetical protein
VYPEPGPVQKSPAGVSPAQRGNEAILECQHIAIGHGLGHAVQSSSSGRAEAGRMGIAPHSDHLFNGKGEIDAVILGHQCDLSGQSRLPYDPKVCPHNRISTLLGVMMPANQVQQGGLATTVGADDTRKPPEGRTRFRPSKMVWPGWAKPMPESVNPMFRTPSRRSGVCETGNRKKARRSAP